MTIVGLKDNVKELSNVIEQMSKQINDTKLDDTMKIISVALLQMSFTPTLSSAMRMVDIARKAKKGESPQE